MFFQIVVVNIRVNIKLLLAYVIKSCFICWLPILKKVILSLNIILSYHEINYLCCVKIMKCLRIYLRFKIFLSLNRHLTIQIEIHVRIIWPKLDYEIWKKLIDFFFRFTIRIQISIASIKIDIDCWILYIHSIIL